MGSFGGALVKFSKKLVLTFMNYTLEAYSGSGQQTGIRLGVR